MINARRNDPCPCGSGLKYKKCCLKSDQQPKSLDPEAARIRAQAFNEMSFENFNEAVALFKNCLESSTEPHEILEAIAACYDGLENYEAAAEYYAKALEICPPSRRRELNYRLGVAAGCAEQIEKALFAFGNCLEFRPDSATKESLYEIIRILSEIHDGHINPAFFRTRVQLQRAFSDMETDKYDSAASRLEKLIEVDPENPAIFYNLGVVYTFLKREEDALIQFQKTVDLNPHYAEAWYNMGQISLIKHRDASRALHCYDRAVSVRPDYIGAHHQRGVVLELLGDRKNALSSWRTTLELDPENKTAKENVRRLEAAETQGA
ncbi:MAG TPA: tetratricopeptide repeat protein [Desulfomonilaceae bacterium]|nr:tetratricopeptide repeat protein [Desulfomonilaceae bacterium]